MEKKDARKSRSKSKDRKKKRDRTRSRSNRKRRYFFIIIVEVIKKAKNTIKTEMKKNTNQINDFINWIQFYNIIIIYILYYYKYLL